MFKSFALLLLSLLFSQLSLFAIKPLPVYIETPEDKLMIFSENSIKVDSVTSVNSWYLTPDSNNNGITVIISNSDFGNMSYSLPIANMLYNIGYNVILYDYRGFGHSSAFPIDSTMLFYNEFVTDLDAVYNFYKVKSPSDKFVFIGRSMGSIITSIYISREKLHDKLLIYDGFVYSLEKVKQFIGDIKHKSITYPMDDKSYEKLINSILTDDKLLVFNGEDDPICNYKNGNSENVHLINYKGGHLEAFSKLTSKNTGDLYINFINDFIHENL